MTIALLVFAALVLAVQHLEHRRTTDKLRDGHETERRQWHRERSELLNRIKPETAQYVPGDDPEPPPPPEPVSMFSDDEYWESKEQLAERLEAA